MKFSICIPNYNYERYLGETIQSILDQNYDDLEILVSDNASTDGSAALVRRFDDPRIRMRINDCNVGFAGNLDRAASMATGDRMILLSSDDLIGPNALATYSQFLRLLPNDGSRAVIASSEYQIDSQGAITDELGLPGAPIVMPEDRVPALEAFVGAPVYRVAGKELLRRCILEMQNPFHFATTTYPRQLYEAIGGYGGGRIFNPDKWFHWRLLAAAEEAYFIDLPLFSYRWHTSNQLALQNRSGALKFLSDEYLNTVELSDRMLATAGLSRDDAERAFVECVIGRHGLATLAKGTAYEARRIFNFGRAVFPQHTRRNLKAQLLRLALPFGLVTKPLAKMLYDRHAKNSWRQDRPIAADRSKSAVSAPSGA